jgi:hypothetical protein
MISYPIPPSNTRFCKSICTEVFAYFSGYSPSLRLARKTRLLKGPRTLFVFIAMPFLALAGAIAITKVPGVVDWSGGVIGLLLGLGLHP